jgi:hypothetical protein
MESDTSDVGVEQAVSHIQSLAGAERYVARAVSQPRFAQTSSVAAALFIV